MKKTKLKSRAVGESPANRTYFEFASPTATCVFLAGTFNDWRPNAIPMIALGQGRWAKELVLPPGDYEYQLVVDGQWTADPQATETAPNPFGGVNSVRRVRNGG